jgi:hypothetical protein
MKWKRESSYYISLQYKDYNFQVFKDYGSMGLSKPFYGIILNNKIIEHGFFSQKEAKEHVYKILEVIKNNKGFQYENF